MSPVHLDPATLRRHLLALDQALGHLQAHVGRDIQQLEQDVSERWTVERGLQLCVQNVLDIATHLSASAGHDVSDYGAQPAPRSTPRVRPSHRGAPVAIVNLWLASRPPRG